MNTRRRNSNKRNRFSIFIPILTIIGIGVITVISSAYEESWTYNWNGIRGNIKDSIKVADYRGITSGFVGVSARSSMDEVMRRSWIMNKATIPELLKLTEYPSGTVKAIAYEGLIRKKDFKGKTDIILKAMNESKYLVSYQMGCIGSDMKIGEYLMTFILEFDRKTYPQPKQTNNYGISESDEQKIMTAYSQLKK